jgi:two-component system response regulator YesN
MLSWKKESTEKLIKLFLVEDEVVMREGIKRRIDWASENIDFVGEAADGELALPMILESRPDIVITDIKMPFMDGLTLSEKVKKELPDTKIIILSGYDEFTYAQEALRIGVTEYLLKPVAPAALLESIRKVACTIEKPEESAPKEKEAEMLDLDMTILDEETHKVIENFLKNGAENETAGFCERIFRSVGEKNAGSVLFLNYLTMDMYLTVVRFLKELGLDTETLTKEEGDLSSVVKRMSNAEEAKEYLERILRAAIRLRDSGASKKYGKLLQEAVSYIDEHYSDEDISLNTVSQACGISPNHFSSIFSQEMGVTFIEYLIGKRMDRAKELLMTTDLRSSEIAFQVGYKDPHYFSYTFKKTQGMTTREYRARGKEE